jgi:hypothetical protein
MAEFTSDRQPAKRGRQKGSKNKRSQFSKALTDEALKQVTEAVTQGESWAIQLVIARTHPALKPITDESSLDALMIKAKIKEVYELEKRIEAIENEAKHTQ